VLLFFGRKLFIFVDCHPSFRFVSSDAMVRAIFPVASKTRISPPGSVRINPLWLAHRILGEVISLLCIRGRPQAYSVSR
jgi:hypothetical protein